MKARPLDPDVGRRAAAEVRRRAHEENTTYTVQYDRISLPSSEMYRWEHRGNGPGATILQRMALAGYDVHYILTGTRRKESP